MKNVDLFCNLCSSKSECDYPQKQHNEYTNPQIQEESMGFLEVRGGFQ